MLNADRHILSAPGIPRSPEPDNPDSREIRNDAALGDSARGVKRDFLSGMSHALKTPLNAILGFSELGARSAQDATLKAYFGTILEAGTTLHNLLNDLLDLTRAREGEYVPSVQWLDWPAWLHLMAGDAREEAGRWDIDVEVESAAERMQLETDPVILRRVVGRLLMNAISYTPAGGAIHLRARVVPDADPASGTLSIRVADTGSGIPESLQARLFEGLLPGEHVETRGPSLGLALSRALLETIGGGLTLESSSPEGSTFLVTLPVRLEQDRSRAHPIPQPVHRASPIDAPDLRGKIVLIADDQPSNRALLRAMLEVCGADILESSNGQEVVDVTAEQRVDLCLLDIHMPVMDGFQAAADLRSRGHVFPIAALSGRAVRPESQTGLFDAWMTKPVDLQTLFSTIRHVMGEPESKMPCEAMKPVSNEETYGEGSDALSEECRCALVERLQLLQPEVASLRRNQSITLIEGFGRKVEELGRAAGYADLTAWGSRLAHCASLFDIGPMNEVLDGFESLVETLEACHAG